MYSGTSDIYGCFGFKLLLQTEHTVVSLVFAQIKSK